MDFAPLFQREVVGSPGSRSLLDPIRGQASMIKRPGDAWLTMAGEDDAWIQIVEQGSRLEVPLVIPNDGVLETWASEMVLAAIHQKSTSLNVLPAVEADYIWHHFQSKTPLTFSIILTGVKEVESIDGGVYVMPDWPGLSKRLAVGLVEPIGIIVDGTSIGLGYGVTLEMNHILCALVKEGDGPRPSRFDRLLEDDP